MSNIPQHQVLTLGESQHAWTVVSGQVEALVSAWESEAEPPSLAKLVPAGTQTLRRLALAELIKVDLEYRWLHRKLPRRVEEYVAEFPELATQGVPCDLLYEEFHVRKQAGDAVEAEEYFERFPEQADELRRLLGLEGPQVSTSLFGRERLEQIDAGEQIDDFELLTRLGRGAFATVFLARQRSMQRLVALKVSSRRDAEPQALAQLDHSNIVRVYDQRGLPDRRLRLLYMQYLAGGTLQEVIEYAARVPPAERSGRTFLEAVDRSLERRGETPPNDSPVRRALARATWPEVVCRLGVCLADALDYAHRRGVFHRDVKPANVLLTNEGVPKLVDFNISFSSKLEGASPAAYFGGSVAYMSPEQLEACDPSHERTPDTLDARADLYSLGVVLWELLATRRPFPDEPVEGSWAATLRRMRETRRELTADALLALPAGCPQGLVRVLRRCLAREPDERFPSCGELRRQLSLCMHPRTQELLAEPQRGWRRLVERLPLAILLMAALVPNVLAAVFNFVYNRREIAERLENAETAFWNVQAVINGVVFPIGLAIGAAIGLPVIRSLKSRSGTHERGCGDARGEDGGKATIAASARRRVAPSLADSFRLRTRCLRFGHYVAALSLSLWLISGVAYPVSLHILAGEMPVSAYVHFFASLTLCGLVAATYPFFLVTFLSVRVVYPALLRRRESGGVPGASAGEADDAEALVLERLARQTWPYLLLAAAVPMLSVMLLVLIGSENQFALGALSSAGLVGFALAYLLARAIQSDLRALQPAVAPISAGGTGEALRSSS